MKKKERFVNSNENFGLTNYSFDKKESYSKYIFSLMDYLEWIERFTSIYNGFTSFDWIDFPDLLSEVDYIKMVQVELLYSRISKYAKDNYISPIRYDFGNYFNTKIFSKFYEIGIYNCGDGIYYCNKILDRKVDNYIDIEDVINNKKTDYVLNCEKTLTDFSSSVNDLYKNGVSINLIVSTFNNTIDNIKNKSLKKYVKKS